MGGLTSISNNDLSALLGGNGLDNLPKPFAHDIFLTHFHIAGSIYREHIDLIVKDLQEGQIVSFLREPDNAYDTLAILVLDRQKRKIGYMPRQINHIPARLMDAGKLLYGKVDSAPSARDIVITLFMKEF